MRAFAFVLFFFMANVAMQPCAGEEMARRSDTTNHYHGVAVPDPYDWLEALNSDETQAWIDVQNRRTQAYLDAIPQRDAIRKRLTTLWDYEKLGTPWRIGNRYFQYRNDGLQNHHVLYTMSTPAAPATVLIDPNTFSADGTKSLASVSVSEDGNWLAYATSASGSDWRAVRIRNIETGEDLDDHLQWVKFSTPSWDQQHHGFYYSRYAPEVAEEKHKSVNEQQRLFYHRRGTAQEDDVLIYENPDEPKWGFGAHETEDEKYLILFIWRGSENKNAISYRKLNQPDAPFTPLFDQFDASYSFLGNEGDTFWFETNHQAPLGKVIAVDLKNPTPAHWRTLIPEQAETLRSVNVVGDRFFCSYLKDAKSEIREYALDGKAIRTIALPGIGSASGFGGKRTHTETFYRFTSFTTPSQVYHYDIASGKSSLLAKPKVDFDENAYTTRQVFFTSKDGTRVPMFISHKKDIALDGKRPTLLYGYGGFNASLTPSFSVTRLVWMEMGGVSVVANLRGGGEYGQAWHEAGTKLDKQNVFDDFIAAAEWLIANDYTSSDHLSIMGGSNGGLLVGACLTQRPELFAAAIPSVGVMDMLKYHTFTIGWAWASDYGTVDDPEEFKALLAYSPLHNTRPAKYPATLITTADTDDRVVPAHSYKFTAALQHAQQGESPILIRVDRKAGHGGGKPTRMVIDEQVDRLAFLYKHLGMSGVE